MKACLFIVFFFSGWSFAQTLKGVVQNANESPVQFAEIYDAVSENRTISNESGFFELAVGDSFALEIQHPQYIPEFFELTYFDKQNGTITYVLNDRIQLIEEVIVSSERMKVMVDQKDVNIIDYIPLDQVVLALKSHKRKRYLSIEGIDTTFRSYLIPFSRKADKLYLDCFDNLHILSEDSAYQVWMSDSLELVSRISMKDFNAFVKPCLADYDSFTVFESFSNYNKHYQVASRTKGQNDMKLIFSLYDKIAEEVARDAYNKILESYYRGTPDHLNVIKLGTWSGDLVEIAKPLDYIWYKNIRAAELDIHS
ncbi:MAG: hypothetical protein AB8B56_13120, partial [Crocinitomicaceae bacterium]